VPLNLLKIPVFNIKIVELFDLLSGMHIVLVVFLPIEILLSFKTKISGFAVWAIEVNFAQTSSELF